MVVTGSIEFVPGYTIAREYGRLTCILQVRIYNAVMMKFRSGCPIASTLDIVGDKWSLLLLRSLALGPASYSDFLTHAERISTNILAERLCRLQEAGLIALAHARRGSIRGTYVLTAKGAALVPALQEIARWGEEHIPGRWTAPDRFFAFDPARYAMQETDSRQTPAE